MTNKETAMSSLHGIMDDPPPVTTVLKYDIEPRTVFTSTASEKLYANLMITVTNSTAAAVDCMEFQFGFLAGAPAGNLTTIADISAVSPSSDQPDWTIAGAGFTGSNPDLYLFTAKPSGLDDYLQLAPNASLVFHLNDLAIDQSVGEGKAPITIIEQTGVDTKSKQTAQQTLSVNKKVGTLSATLSVDPPGVIAPGTPIELSWTVIDSDHWQLYEVDTATLLYDSVTSSPPGLTQWPLPPQQLKPEQTTTYRLLAWAGQSYTASDTVAMVKVVPPQILCFSASPRTYEPGKLVNLCWQTEGALSAALSQVILGNPGIINLGQVDLQSNGYPLPPKGISIYSLTAKNQVETVLQTAVAPVPQTIGLAGKAGAPVYDDQNNLVWILDSLYPKWTWLKSLNPVDGSVKQSIRFDYLYPPALVFDGTYLWFLNTSAKSSLVQIMASTGQVVNSAISVAGVCMSMVYDRVNDLIWVVSIANNVVLLRIDAKTGSVVGNPVAVGGDFGQPFSIVFDGSTVWANYGFMLNLIPASRDPNIQAAEIRFPGIVLGCIAFDGNNVWGGDMEQSQIVKFDHKGQILAGYPAGNDPVAILGDGKRIWTSNRQDQAVTMLSAADGRLLGAFPVPATPGSLAFDGSSLWVCTDNGNNTGDLIKF